MLVWCVCVSVYVLDDAEDGDKAPLIDTDNEHDRDHTAQSPVRLTLHETRDHSAECTICWLVNGGWCGRRGTVERASDTGGDCGDCRASQACRVVQRTRDTTKKHPGTGQNACDRRDSKCRTEMAVGVRRRLADA